MIVYDVPTKVLDTKIFPQYTNADLSIWHYIYWFVKSGEAKEINTHTNAHTNTQTQTQTHTHAHKTAAAAALSSFHGKSKNQVILGGISLCVNPCDMVLNGVLE